MFLFDPLKNIRKPLFSVFRDIKSEQWEEKG